MTYAALYIKPDKSKNIVANAKNATTIQGQIKQAFDSARVNIKNFDIKGFAKNLTLEGSTNFVQKYATAGLTKLINGEEITNQTMLDSLFNGYAPALDMTSVQMGFNSVMEMKNAIQSANINVAGFMNGFSGALSTVINNKKQAEDYSNLGDEITIDMVINMDRQNIAETPDRRVQSGQIYNEYIHILPKILSFEAKIKDGGKYTAQEYEEIMDEVFASKKPFTFRAGEKIFENYVFTSFIPAEDFEQSLNFSAEIKKINVGEITIEKVNIPKSNSTTKKHTIKKNENSNTGSKSKDIKNKTTPKKLYGIGKIINIDQGVANLVEKLEAWK